MRPADGGGVWLQIRATLVALDYDSFQGFALGGVPTDVERSPESSPSQSVNRSATAEGVENAPSLEPRLDKSAQRIQRMFGQISPRYDLMNHVLSLGIDISWRNFTVRTVAPEGDAPILDVCTGTGDLALAYWEAAGRRVEVIGSDFTPEMLEIARQKRLARKPSDSQSAVASIEFVEADATRLPFESNRFQIVSVAFGLRNIVDTEAGVREMTRVCQPGGRVAILEFSQPTIPGLSWLYRNYFKHVLPRVGQWMAQNDESAYTYLPASVSQFPSGKELADRLTAWGLVDVTWRPLTLGVATLYVGRKPR